MRVAGAWCSIHGVERRREVAGEDVVGEQVREARGQSTTSTKAKWCSSVDVRRFCDPRWLFAGDSFDGQEAARSVVGERAKANIP
jgi:hypothetical protein